MASLQSLLAPQVLTKVVSQVASTSDWLTNLFGVTPGGVNEWDFGHGRHGAYNVYDNVRKVAQGRAPGAAAGRRAANPIKQVAFTYPRMHDSVSLLAETLHNLGRIDDPARRDEAGANMISRQTETLGQLAANWRKAMLIGALRDSLYLGFNGDTQYVTYSSAGNAMQIPFQMPAGNKTQLNMLGGGNLITATWASDSTDIPLHLGNINAAFQRLNGGHLGAVITNWGVWNYVIQNAFIQAVHGTAAPPFIQLTGPETDDRIARTMKNVFRARLSTAPNVIWYITDEGLEVGAPGSESFEKICEDNKAIFVGFEPGQDDVLGAYIGSEPISERDGDPATVKRGMAAWSVDRSNPTSTDLFVLDNSLIVNHIPTSIAYGTVVF